MSERSKKLGPEQRDAADAADAATAAAGGAAGRETILLFGSIVSGLIDRLLRWISDRSLMNVPQMVYRFPMDYRWSSFGLAMGFVWVYYLKDRGTL